MSPSARFAGVPSPRSKPSFRTERFGLWAANSRTNGESPVMAGTQTDGQPTRHFSTNGNAYWSLPLAGLDQTVMSWDKEDYFGIKLYIRPRSVSGRIQVFRKGESGRGGPFLDIVDGKARFGWWDNDLKKEVSVETSGQVFWPGRVHYVYIRKRWPPGNTTGGNWEDSFWTNLQIRRLTMAAPLAPGVGTAVTDGTRIGNVLRLVNATTFDVYTTTDSTAWAGNISGVAISAVTVPSSDLFIVKRFKAGTDTLRDKTAFEAYIDPTPTNATINAVSFTSADAVRVAGVDAIGVVSPPGALFRGAVGGGVDVRDMDPTGAVEYYVPRLEMDEMYWTWGTGAGVALAGKTWRVGNILPDFGGVGIARITVTDPYNMSTSPDFSAVNTDQQGQLSTGIQLIKSPGFDLSKSPDNSGTTIYFMGSPDQGEATSTYQPFDGEVWCPGFTVVAPGSAGVDARCFQNASATATDPTLIGADQFEEEVFAAGNTALHHQLAYTASYNRFAWDGRLYGGADIVASTQPAMLPLDSLDTTGPTITVNPLSPAIFATAKPFWTYVQPRGVWSAERWIAVGFRDPVQGISGRPSPAARVKALEDDTTNPSGVVRIVVTNLPVGPQGCEVVVYESAADGNATTLFEAVRVPNGTSEVAIDLLESLLTLNAAADFDAYEPPRCSLVAAPASRMTYGALEVQPTAIVPSRVAQPGLADFGKLFRLEGGAGDRITAMAELDGLFAIFKRRAMGSVQFTVEGYAQVDLVSSGVGCVSAQGLQAKDDLLWFVSDRGIQVSQRNGVTNLGKPQYVGESVESFFSSTVDLRRLQRASAAINRTRNQFVVALRLATETRTNARISADLESEGITFSRYSGPNVCALATIQSREPGADLVVGGTEEGFVVWMDRSDTALLMMGPDPLAWGALQIASYGGTGSTVRGITTTAAGLIDIDLAGPLGVTAIYRDPAGNEREVALLGAEGLVLHYAEVLLQPVAATQQMMMGCASVLWESAWLDMGNCERPKSCKFVDLVFDTKTVLPKGKVRVTLYADKEGLWSTVQPAHVETLDLSVAPYRIAPTAAATGKWFKLVIEQAPNTSDVRFDLAALVWRITDEGLE